MPSEAEEQKTVFIWAQLARGKYPALEMMYHIPNEGKRSLRYGSELKEMGLKSGMPDICLPIAKGIYHGLYIEMKTSDRRRAKITPEQSKCLNRLNECGYYAIVCYGSHEAITVIENYLALQ